MFTVAAAEAASECYYDRVEVLATPVWLDPCGTPGVHSLHTGHTRAVADIVIVIRSEPGASSTLSQPQATANRNRNNG